LKHEIILKQLLVEAESNPNTLGFLVFGSVATGTYNEQSDIDTLTVLQKSKSSSGIKNTFIDGIKVGNMFFTHEILVQSTKTVPYLLYPLVEAKLLFDRENTISPLLKEINKYFDENSEVRNKWIRYYKRFKQEKAQFGYEKTTIIDVWNELEKEYTGRSKRPFFNAFYMTNPTIFSLLKRFL
jgi:predicted nucleotidyltransferase